jgi:hypothetical protein
MQYELFNWERPGISKDEYLRDLETIKEAFMRVLLSDAPLERYVRMHQAGIGQLSVARKPTLLSCLEELLVFLERHAAAHLDPDLPLPAFRSRTFTAYLRDNLGPVRERLTGAGIDNRLSEVVSELFRESIRDGVQTYRQWFPLRDLMQFILQLPKEAQVKGDLSTSQQLVELMYCLNLNSTSIYRYIKSAILETVEDKDLVSEKLPELNRVKRYIKWLEHRPGYQFVEGRVSLTQMLAAWLEELEKQKVVETSDTDESGFGLDSRKVITSLTVNELGLLVRLFMETGVFRTRNRKGLAQFMAKNVVTLKKEAVDEVSSNHLYGTLYSMTDATLDSVQGILNRMLVRLQKLRLEQRQKKPAKGKK